MTKGKRYKENDKYKKSKLNNIVIILIQIIFIIVIVYTGIEIYKWYKENKHNKEIIDNVADAIIVDEENKEDLKVDFIKLKEINSETVAWLKVNGTNIEYPIVKATNNDYYLTHSFDKSYNGAGWIFSDYKNKFDNTDKNIVIYGHNRRDGSMFGTLENILNENWYNNEENLKIKFSTESENSIYQVFSIYRIEKEDYYITTNFNNNFKKFINTINKRSIKDFGVDLNENDQILTLSTCDNNNKYRVVLHAKKVLK